MTLSDEVQVKLSCALTDAIIDAGLRIFLDYKGQVDYKDVKGAELDPVEKALLLLMARMPSVICK